jgi:hypothetical protein
MQISFRGPRLKVKRAYKHIDELEVWLDNLIQSNIDTARAHKDVIPGSESDHVVVNRPPGFSDGIAPIVGDAVHNLRASLDLIASAIIVAGGKDDPTLAYFPLGDTRKSCVNSRGYEFIERVAADLALLIADIIKSYKTDGDSRFWALNRLDRMDKHRILVPTLTQSRHFVIAIREDQEDDPPDAPPGATFMLAGKTTKDGTVVSVAREPRLGSKAYIHNQSNGYAAVEILFGRGEVFENQPIIPTLRELADLISHTIDKFEAHCQ